MSYRVGMEVAVDDDIAPTYGIPRSIEESEQKQKPIQLSRRNPTNDSFKQQMRLYPD